MVNHAQAVELCRWDLLTEAGAILELAEKLGVIVGLGSDGKLITRGNVETVQSCLADLIPRYKAQIIGTVENRPPAELEAISAAHDTGANTGAMYEALRVAIDAYCALAGYPADYLARLQAARVAMRPSQVVGSLCAFRYWAHELTTQRAA